ncbi:type II toxin-antitoxin system VapC family toxin [Methylocapsa palsarum]|uniref:type II toxin-antitoxin system VapC family toxin n=1 Tax=Methylocapsa palsarum TaxID=1612308 RepID=UPI000B829531|nr:type II toxin-antitoxin system VapC family toxin [Methylocapsa palsarum]
MRITADTNVLVRAAVADDRSQAKVAAAALRSAEVVAVTLPVLCEFVWVLARGYKLPSASIADAIRKLIDSATVKTDRPAVEAGLALLDAGGDFADGIIAFEGRRLGGTVFTSFDRAAVQLIQAADGEARLLSAR